MTLRSRANLAFLLLLLVCCGAACSRKQPVRNAAPAVAEARYIIMEKVLADAPGRARTTMKIIIPGKPKGQTVKTALEKALADIRKDDPSLKAAIFWAYGARSELNGSNFTLGKLEWGADGKDFNGQSPLTPNPKLDIIAP